MKTAYDKELLQKEQEYISTLKELVYLKFLQRRAKNKLAHGVSEDVANASVTEVMPTESEMRAIFDGGLVKHEAIEIDSVSVSADQPKKRRGRPRKMESVLTEAPKRRGRPRKMESVLTEMPKRRGRPRKMESVLTETPKRRGRPKLQQEILMTVANPKRRGRPRKLESVLTETPKRRGRPQSAEKTLLLNFFSEVGQKSDHPLKISDFVKLARQSHIKINNDQKKFGHYCYDALNTLVKQGIFVRNDNREFQYAGHSA